MLGRKKSTGASAAFTCFGGECSVALDGEGPAGAPAEAVETAHDYLIECHRRFTRFKAESELSALNHDPSDRISVSPLMARFVRAAVDAAEATGGLVDPTLIDEIEAVGYRDDRLRGTLALPMALAMAPPRKPGGPHPDARWREIDVDLEGGIVTRPAGVKLDGGGIVKGLLADELADRFSAYRSFAIQLEGDARLGGTEGAERVVVVEAPFSGEVLHEFEVTDVGVATTGISKRSWLEAGKPAHHLLDPATGQPAYTGVVQATALAPTALEGETLAKAAILSGPDGAARWLPHGGVVVLDDGSHTVVEPRSGKRTD